MYLWATFTAINVRKIFLKLVLSVFKCREHSKYEKLFKHGRRYWPSLMIGMTDTDIADAELKLTGYVMFRSD